MNLLCHACTFSILQFQSDQQKVLCFDQPFLNHGGYCQDSKNSSRNSSIMNIGALSA